MNQWVVWCPLKNQPAGIDCQRLSVGSVDTVDYLQNALRPHRLGWCFGETEAPRYLSVDTKAAELDIVSQLKGDIC